MTAHDDLTCWSGSVIQEISCRGSKGRSILRQAFLDWSGAGCRICGLPGVGMTETLRTNYEHNK
jgi:hypothetical protein